jgi:HSP20 family molecular chaperone IbpA
MSESDFDLWMWYKANDLLDQAEKLHRQFYKPLGSSAQLVWEPPVDVFETDEDFWVIIALPGVDPDQVEIVVESGSLAVRGCRSLPRVCQRAIVHRMELPSGRFERRIELPPGRYRPGEKEFVHGCLMFSLKKLV